MSMPLGFATKVSLFSMRRRIVRTILSLLPCIVLISIMFVGSTIPNGLVNEVDTKILSKAQSRQEYVTLNSYYFAKQNFSQTTGPVTTEFDQEKYDLVTKSAYVDAVYPQRGSVSGVGDIGNVKSSSVSFNGVSPEFAKLYTAEKFDYLPGQPIPVLINPVSIWSQYYNWNDSSTLEIDYGNQADVESKMVYTTLKDSEKLYGTTFNLEFGKFPNLPEAFEEQSFNNFGPSKSKLSKLSAKDYEILEKRLREIYGSYWNYDALKSPISFQFKIVGFLPSDSEGSAIPNDAIVAIWNSLYARQLDSRTSKALDKDLLSAETGKIEVLNGLVNSSSYYSYPATSWQKDPSVSAWQVDISQVSIPGLLVTTVKNAKGQNEYALFTDRPLSTNNFANSGAIVKLKSADDREAYVKFLNDSGLFFFDNNPVSTIKSIRKGANIFVTWLTIILGIVVAFILLTTVSRFVADSRKEIGVWRAIGARRIDITNLVLVRMILLLVFGIILGVVIGYGVSVLLANYLANSVNAYTTSINPFSANGGNFVGSIIVTALGGEVPTLEVVKLLSPNWSLLLSRLGLLGLITILVGLIPALRAARISPVSAIRDSE